MMPEFFKSVLIVFVLLLSSVFIFAQNKVVRDIDSFDKVSVSDDVKVTFRKAEVEKITILAEGIGYDRIVSETEGRELKIRIKTGLFKETDVQITVEYVTLRAVDASNKADVKFEEKLTGDQITLKATGGAVINVDVEINALKATVSNGGRIEIAGSANLQEVDASLGGKYNAYEFETKKGYVKSNTNADVVVWSKEYLEATAGSKAVLKYRGSPEDVQSSTNLGGTIQGDL